MTYNSHKHLTKNEEWSSASIADLHRNGFKI